MKILAVDDDPIILELLKQFVADIGERGLTTANSAIEALAILEAANPCDFDCFLFDIQMPVMDGIALVRRVRAIPHFVDIPILMLTAMSDKRHIDAAFAAGATDYVNKPFEVSELRARINLVKGLASARRYRTKKVFAASTLREKKSDNEYDAVELHEPISIYDVENVIEHFAMGNYVSQLSRNALFGSTTFAFSIRKMGEFNDALTPFEFSSLIADVAEVISDVLSEHQFLMSYSGNGTFVCVTESGWQPNMIKLMDRINLSLSRTELYNNRGQRLNPRVSCGDAIRLIWKSGSAVLEALASAQTTAEAASDEYDRNCNILFSA